MHEACDSGTWCERSTVPEPRLARLRAVGATATSLVVTGLTNGSGYRFQVAANNAVGTGSNSALSTVVIPATVPGAPVIGTARRTLSRKSGEMSPAMRAGACRVVANVVPMPGSSVRVHATAIVEDGADVGSGTSVWHHAHVRSGARVGTDCVLGKNVYVDTLAVVGDRCKLQNNVSVYHGVSIGDDVFVGPSATFTNDLVPRAFNADWKVVETHVHNGASIGANATIVCGVTLGELCMVAAGATVTHDVADHQLVAGTPARHRGWVCRCGKVVSREADRPANLVCPDCA